MKIRLVTFDHKVFGFSEHLTSILNAGIVALEADFRLEHKVTDFTALPDEEGIALGWLFLGGFTEDGPVFDRPEFLLPGPTAEVFAIEEVFKFLCVCRQAADATQKSDEDGLFFHD